MNKASDIQEFRKLFALWLEAETTRAQESRLRELAEGLKADTLDPDLYNDVMLIASLGVVADEASAACGEFDSDAFVAFVDKTVESGSPKRRSYRLLWTGIASAAAAAVLLLVTVGKHDREAVVSQTTMPVAVETQTVHIAKTEVQPEVYVEPVKAEPDRNVKPAEAPRIAKTSKPVVCVAAEEATAIQEETDVLDVREVTDPDEAARILSESCNLLAFCMSKAEESTQEAIMTLNDNINIIYTKI